MLAHVVPARLTTAPRLGLGRLGPAAGPGATLLSRRGAYLYLSAALSSPRQAPLGPARFEKPRHYQFAGHGAAPLRRPSRALDRQSLVAIMP